MHRIVESAMSQDNCGRAAEEIVSLAKFPQENPSPVLRISGDGEILYANKASSPLVNAWRCGKGGPLSGQWYQIVLDALSSGRSRQAELECEEKVFSLTFAPVADSHYVNVYGLDITERKRTEEELKRSRDHLDRVLNSMYEGVVVIDPNFNIRDANTCFLKQHAVNREEAIGRHCYEITHCLDEPCSGAEHACPLREVLDTSQPATTEHVHQASDGRQIIVEIKAFPLLSEDGRVDAVVELVHDITERKRAEKELLETSRLNQKLLDSMPCLMFLLRSNSREIVASNEAAAKVGAVPGEKCFAAWAKREDPCPWCLAPSVWATGEPQQREVEAFDKAWDVHWIPVGQDLYLWYASDITDRKWAEEEIAKLAKFPAENPNPVLRISRDGEIVYNNDAARSLLAPWDCRQGEAVSGQWRRIVSDTLRTGRSRQIEIDCCDRVFSLTFAPVSESNYVNIYALDVTGLKRAEEERRELEAQFQQAQKLESLGVLAGGIAHDFNNLLVSILGNADLALRALSPVSPGRPTVEEIKKAAIRASELTNQMLAYSGRGWFVVQPLNLNELVQEMGHLLQVSISKKVGLKYDLVEDLPAVEADAAQIRQVVMNLITNASEAIGEGSGAIVVATGVMDATRDYLSKACLDDNLPEGQYVYLEVSDTGCGMDEQTITKLFDPFFTTKFAGRGLGLAAVLGIVRGHRGCVTVESQVGKGTTFRVLLPRSEKPVEAMPEHPAAVSLKQWRGEGTILVADDEESVRKVAKTMLEDGGFRVLLAGNGQEALEVFRQHADEILLVLLDMTMPEMDGQETFREMQRVREDVKVILFSGYDEQDTTSRFAGNSLAGFIQKPFGFDALMRKVRQVLAPPQT